MSDETKRPSPAGKDRLRREIRELRAVGSLMSNVCFNLSQNPPKVVESYDAEVLSDLRKRWDAIERAEPIK